MLLHRLQVTQSFMTRRQATYKPQSSDGSFVYSKIQTPLNVGIGLYLHQTTRSKKRIDMFDSMNLSTKYDKVLDIKKDVSNAIIEKRSESNGVLIPSCLIENSRPFFTIENTDIKIDTPTGKHQLHGTAMAVFQQNSQPKTKTVMRIQRRSKRHRSNVPLYEDINVSETVKKSVTTTDSYFAEISEDTFWFLLQTLCMNMGSKASVKAWQNL